MRLLRRRAFALSLVLFAFLWGVVFMQMATGHDPVLGSKGSQQAKQATTAQPSASTQASQLEFDPTTGQIVHVPASGDSASATTQQSAPEPAPVVTSQS